jgi:CBS domain-containing protein
MRVAEIMSARVETIAAGATPADARDLMRMKGIHHLVVTSGSKPAGLVSARDLASIKSDRPEPFATVAELMSTPVTTVDVTTTVGKAANLMRGHAIGSLVVTRRGKVAGIVTVSDLLELVGRGASRQPKRQARPTLGFRVPHRPQHRAGGTW